ncbi:hypothetical protein GINT2_001310 [Glugoides intestinalis]
MQLFSPVDSFVVKIADSVCYCIILIVEKAVIPLIYYSFTLLFSVSIIPIVLQCILMRFLGFIVSISYLVTLILNIKSTTLRNYHAAVHYYTENMYKIKNHTLLKLFSIIFLPLTFVFGFLIISPLDIINIILSKIVVTLTKENITSTIEYKKRLFKITSVFNMFIYVLFIWYFKHYANFYIVIILVISVFLSTLPLIEYYKVLEKDQNPNIIKIKGDNDQYLIEIMLNLFNNWSNLLHNTANFTVYLCNACVVFTFIIYIDTCDMIKTFAKKKFACFSTFLTPTKDLLRKKHVISKVLIKDLYKKFNSTIENVSQSFIKPFATMFYKDKTSPIPS